MSEFTRAMHLCSSGLGLHVTQYPSKKFGYVGSVPGELAYIKADGSTPSVEEVSTIASSCVPAMLMKSLAIRTRVFSTREDAVNFAESKGYKVQS